MYTCVHVHTLLSETQPYINIVGLLHVVQVPNLGTKQQAQVWAGGGKGARVQARTAAPVQAAMRASIAASTCPPDQLLAFIVRVCVRISIDEPAGSYSLKPRPINV